MKTNFAMEKAPAGKGGGRRRPVLPKAASGGFMLFCAGALKRSAPVLMAFSLALTAPAASAASAQSAPAGGIQAPAHRTAEKMPDLPPVFKKDAEGVVAKALDGDTLKLKDGRIIRLACIDAPDLEPSLTRTAPVTNSRDFHGRDFRADSTAAAEKKAGKRQERYAQYYADISRRFLQQTAAGKKVTLRAARQEKDRQGRILCDLELEDGSTLSARMVRSGCAYVVYDPDFPKGYQQKLVELQSAALRRRTGFWSLILSGSAAGRTYTGDSATRLFYSSSDERGLRLKPRMRVYFGNLLDAFGSGYAPDRSTDFWPVNIKVPEKKTKKDRKDKKR